MSGGIVRQHGEHHRPPGWNTPTDPGGPDPLRWLTRYIAPAVLRAHHRVAGGLAIGSASEQPLTWFEWENEDDTVFDETLLSGELQKVGFLAQGLYTVTIKLIWELLGGFDGVTEVCWLDDSTTAGNWPFGETGNYGQFGEGRDSDSFVYPLTMSVTDKFPRFGTTVGDISGGHYGRVFVKVIQRSGLSRDLKAATLTIAYWGPTRTSI